MWRRLRKALCGAALAAAGAGAAAAEPPMWRVKDADSTIVLFGSVHALPEGVEWRTPALDQAIAEADELWFELPRDPALGQPLDARWEKVMRQAFLPPGQGLSSMLSLEARKRLGEAAGRLGRRPEDFERFRPWFAALLIEIAQMMRTGHRADLGVETQISAAARAKPVRAFETVEEQVEFLAGAPLDEQVKFLEGALEGVEDEAEGDEVLRIWLSGDVKRLEAEVVAPLKAETPALYERLLAGRNRRWADRIETMLLGKGEVLVVVGAAHLLGEDGVPALLRKRGVTVEGP